MKKLLSLMMALIITLTSVVAIAGDKDPHKKKDKTTTCKYKIAQKKKEIRKAKRTKVTPYYASRRSHRR